MAQRLFLLCISHNNQLETSTPHKLMSKMVKDVRKLPQQKWNTICLFPQRPSYTINCTYYAKLMDIIQINANTAPTYFATSNKIRSSIFVVLSISSSIWRVINQEILIGNGVPWNPCRMDSQTYKCNTKCQKLFSLNNFP